MSKCMRDEVALLRNGWTGMGKGVMRDAGKGNQKTKEGGLLYLCSDIVI